MSEFKNPMLAVDCKGKVPYPCWISPKLDGVRVTVQGGRLLSRTNKPIPNKYCQSLFVKSDLEGLDGELIVGSPTDKDVFQNTMSGVMSVDGEPDVHFFVFDVINSDRVFDDRYLAIENANALGHFDNHPRVRVVPNTLIDNDDQLTTYQEVWLAAGYEGVMIRKPGTTYKHGRSTLKEGKLLKLKSFCDAEAKVIGIEELMNNNNEAYYDETGAQKRSTMAEGLTGAGVLGAFVVEDVTTGTIFKVGSGYTADQRKAFYSQNYIGKVLTYKHFPVGAKDKPRFPVFKGFRDQQDI